MSVYINKGYSIASLMAWLVISSTVIPLLCSTLILTATYYSKTASKLLMLSELSFFKSVIQLDVMTGSLTKQGDTVSIFASPVRISYSLSESRLKRIYKTPRYLTSLLHVKSLAIATDYCIHVTLLANDPLTVCQPKLSRYD